MIWLTDLAQVLRTAGVKVIEVPGWQTRSYHGWTPGYNEAPSHVMCHHTASNIHSTPSSDVAYILSATYAPLANLYLARDGTYHVIAAGRTCTNGAGHDSWGGGVPDNQMNSHAIGIEAANNGIGEPWPEVQTTAYVKGVAGLCAGYSIPNDHVRGHMEWAPGRKIDPAGPSPWAVGRASWDMNGFRASVAAYATPPPVIIPRLPPTFPQVKPDSGDDQVNIATNSEKFYNSGPGVVKFLVTSTGQLRHLNETEWIARGSEPGTPLTNAQISALGVAT